MGETGNIAIIHLIGPEGSGKTTLCRLFLDALKDKTVLAVDASRDNYLTLSYGIGSSTTVGILLSQLNGNSPLSHEAIDWALHDLPISIPTESEAEILSLGHFPEELTNAQKELLSYGLPRLFGMYEAIIWDGPLGIMKSILSVSDIRPLIVITPDDEDYCKTVGINKAMILLSKGQTTDVLPPTATDLVQKGSWKFIGKLPPLSPPEKRVRELPQYFQDCFHKLELPFELRPRLV